MAMRYFCRWLATFSRVIPSTFSICKMALGTAVLTPSWLTTCTKRLCSSSVQMKRGRFCDPATSPTPPPLIVSLGLLVTWPGLCTLSRSVSLDPYCGLVAANALNMPLSLSLRLRSPASAAGAMASPLLQPPAGAAASPASPASAAAAASPPCARWWYRPRLRSSSSDSGGNHTWQPLSLPGSTVICMSNSKSGSGPTCCSEYLSSALPLLPHASPRSIADMR
mmetsp:Transcript_19559/g.58019  ORF Transcript_19559/g.58019 Transcript_19559/m.58019 type:complete len:223 (+) Transcript_19559:1739-2407(+)